MKSNKIAILLAVAAIVLSVLACGAPSGPSASNFYMANDQAGQNKTTTFTSSDDFFVFSDVSGIPAGTAFQSRWYAVDVPGEDPTKPFLTGDYAYESNVKTIFFQAMNSNGWPSGSYKVEIYMSDTKVGEVQFSVK